MTVLLRPVRDSDLPAVGDLHHRSRAAAYAGLVSPVALSFGDGGALGEWWTERLRWEGDTHRLTVAVDGDTLAGFTYVGPSPSAGVRELYAIHVDPARVGTGVGRSLMADALPYLGPRAVLWVLEGNVRARRFYAAAGWAEDGETRQEPIGGEMTSQVRYTRSV